MIDENFLNSLIQTPAGYNTRFKWRQALLHEKWGVCVYPTDLQRYNIMTQASRLESLMFSLFPGLQMDIHSWLRCPVYNSFIGGAKSSSHIDGLATDFEIIGTSCDEARIVIEPHLIDLGLRMEKLPLGSPWVHIDSRDPSGGERYFIP